MISRRMMVGEPSAKPLAGGIKTFSCPSCGGTVGIRAVGDTVTVVCQSCGSLIDVANDNVAIIKQAAVAVQKSDIPLGARGTLFGVDWEVIGYTIRRDSASHYSWREYLLFNPYQGYRFLVESDGHWTFAKMLRRDITDAAETVTDGQREYRVYDRGTADVIYVMGEFYWRVKVGDKSMTADYICPPHMLSLDRSDGDIIWSHGIYVAVDQVQQAFNVAKLPIPRGIAANQPSPYMDHTKGMWLTFAVLCFVLLVGQIIAISRAADLTVYQRSVHVDPVMRGQLAISDPITIPGGIGNVLIVGYSPVSQNWVELDVSLVNDATQESDDLIMPIEYYSGSDSDGPWSEGGQYNTAYISAVPGGNYHLQVDADAGAFVQNWGADFTIVVKRDVPLWGNFWITVLLLLIYPAYVVMRRRNFEVRRWSNSDYAPAAYRRSST